MRGSCTNSNCSFSHNPKMKGNNVKRKSESEDSPKGKRAKTNDQKKSFLDKGGVEEIIRDMLRKENQREVPSNQVSIPSPVCGRRSANPTTASRAKSSLTG